MEINIQKTCKTITCYKNAKNKDDKDVTILKSQGIFCIALLGVFKMLNIYFSPPNMISIYKMRI